MTGPTTQGGAARRPGRLGWYAARLRAMSASEVVFRGRRALESAVEDRLWRAAPALWARAWEPGPERLVGRAAPAAPRGPLAPERVAVAAAGAAGEIPRVVAAARAGAAGRVRFFGYPELVVAPGLQARDPVTGRLWPAVHAKRLDYRHSRIGDPKWVWEVNRLQALPLLCAAGRLAGDDALLAEAARRAVAWAGDARPPYGVAWSNGFEAGLRGISLALVHDALRGTSTLDGAGRDALLRALWQHARWILRDPSRGSSANNHLLGEAAGLLAIALLAPELRESEDWAARALATLSREAEAQVLPDGAGVEQAFAYHLFVCDLLLLTASLVETCRGERPPEPVLAALRRSGDALTVQVAPGEPEPAYGDADDGRAFLFDADEGRSARGVAASIACAVGHRACAELAGDPDLPALLLFGEAGAERFRSASGPPAAASAVLPDAGLVVLRRGGVRALFDAGPLGYLQIVAHGHADTLSVVLSEGGDELVTDPGTGTYFGDEARRRAFRGTAAHPTVSVGGRDQAEYGGPFLWLRHPQTRLRHVDLERGTASGEVTSTAGAARVRHRRALLVLPGGEVVVYDRIDADNADPCALTWPFHPRLEVVARGDRLLEARLDGRPRLLLALAAARSDGTPALEVTVEAGEWSRRLDRVEPAAVVRALAAGSGRVDLATLLVPARGRTLADPGLTLVRSDAGALARFRLDGPLAARFDLDSDDCARLVDA